MKTNLHWDEEIHSYKAKPSSLQVFWLEKEGENQLTGKKTPIGSVMFNLSDYMNRTVQAEKLYLDKTNSDFIEISVKSKPVDSIQGKHRP